MEDVRAGSLEQAQPLVTRRQVVQRLFAGGVATLAGGAILSACAESKTVTSITLNTGDWPFKAMPTKAEQQKGVADKVYATVLQRWLDQNPGVKLKYRPSSMYDTTEKMHAAIKAGLAPDWYNSGAKTEGLDAARSYPARGLAANIDEIIKKYNVESLLADYSLARYRTFWGNNGSYAGLPIDMMLAGPGVLYRRDLIRELGLAEPRPGWTWEDFSILAKGLSKRKGGPAMGAPAYMIGYIVNTNTLEFLRKVPRPGDSWHYRYDHTPWLDDWQRLVGLYRGMIQDGSVRQIQTTYELELLKGFVNEDYYLIPTFPWFVTVKNITTPVNDLSRKLGKPLDDIVGYSTYPLGENGGLLDGLTFFEVVYLNPRLKGEALDKAANLWLYMFYGDGYIDQRAQLYQETKDPRQAYDFVTPGNRYQKNPKVPVTVADAWGSRFVQAWMDCLNVPILPDGSAYYPADNATGPSAALQDAALKALSTTDEDVATILRRLEGAYNQQASKLKSSISEETFRNGSKRYYADLETFWKQNSPTFYANKWSKYRDDYVTPVLSS